MTPTRSPFGPGEEAQVVLMLGDWWMPEEANEVVTLTIPEPPDGEEIAAEVDRLLRSDPTAPPPPHVLRLEREVFSWGASAVGDTVVLIAAASVGAKVLDHGARLLVEGLVDWLGRRTTTDTARPLVHSEELTARALHVVRMRWSVPIDTELTVTHEESTADNLRYVLHDAERARYEVEFSVVDHDITLKRVKRTRD